MWNERSHAATQAVKGADLPGSEEEEQFGKNNESLLHGTNVLKHVVSPWFGSNRIVCVDQQA